MRDIDPTASEWLTSGYIANSRPGGFLYDLGSVVAAVAPTVISSVLGSDSSSGAADSQAASTAASIAEQRRRDDQAREDYAPYRQAGVNALRQLTGSPASKTEDVFDAAAYLAKNQDVAKDAYFKLHPYEHYKKYGAGEGRQFTYIPGTQTEQVVGEMDKPVTAADVMQDPGYQFGLQQGQLALDRKAAAAGGRVSGASLKDAAEYATNYATTGFGAAYQRRQDRLNRLAALANIGQTATGGSTAAGVASSNAISSLATAQGNASGAAQLAQGNIWSNAANQLGAVGQRWAGSQPSQPSASGFNSNLTGGAGGLTQSDIYSAFA